MMHGGGQWASFIGFFGGGTSCSTPTTTSTASASRRIAADERATSIMVVGDAMARPLADALAAPDDDSTCRRVFVVGSGGAILSTAIREELRRRLPNVISHGQLRRVGDRRTRAR